MRGLGLEGQRFPLLNSPGRGVVLTVTASAPALARWPDELSDLCGIFWETSSASGCHQPSAVSFPQHAIPVEISIPLLGCSL